ncbi:MAG: hypothetical protein ACO3JG_13880 [Luteolibacter sp.]
MTPLVGWAGTSLDYSLEPAVLDAGGQLVSSADYAVDSSIGDGEVAASATYGLRAGFAGMLMDPVSLDLVSADSGGLVDERSTLQLTARIRYDDDSLDPFLLDPEQVVWVVRVVVCGCVIRSRPAWSCRVCEMFHQVVRIAALSGGY